MPVTASSKKSTTPSVNDTIAKWNKNGEALIIKPMTLHSYVWSIVWYKIRKYHSIHDCSKIIAKLHKLDYGNKLVSMDVLNSSFVKIPCNTALRSDLIDIQNNFSCMYRAYTLYCFSNIKGPAENELLFNGTRKAGGLDMYSSALISNLLIRSLSKIPNIGISHYIPMMSEAVADITGRKLPAAKTCHSYISGMNKLCKGAPSHDNSFFTECGRLMEQECVELYGVKLY